MTVIKMDTCIVMEVDKTILKQSSKNLDKCILRFLFMFLVLDRSIFFVKYRVDEKSKSTRIIALSDHFLSPFFRYEISYLYPQQHKFSEQQCSKKS